MSAPQGGTARQRNAWDSWSWQPGSAQTEESGDAPVQPEPMESRGFSESDDDAGQSTSAGQKAASSKSAKQGSSDALQQLIRKIADFASRRRLNDAVRTFEQIEKRGLEPSVQAYASLINAYVNSGDMAGADSAFSRMLAAGLRSNVVCTALLKGYCRSGDVRRAQTVLEKMSCQEPPATGSFEELQELGKSLFLGSCAAMYAPKLPDLLKEDGKEAEPAKTTEESEKDERQKKCDIWQDSPEAEPTTPPPEGSAAIFSSLGERLAWHNCLGLANPQTGEEAMQRWKALSQMKTVTSCLDFQFCLIPVLVQDFGQPLWKLAAVSPHSSGTVNAPCLPSPILFRLPAMAVPQVPLSQCPLKFRIAATLGIHTLFLLFFGLELVWRMNFLVKFLVLGLIIFHAHSVRPDLRLVNTLLRGCVRAGDLATAESVFRRLPEWELSPDASSCCFMSTLLGQALQVKKIAALLRLPALAPAPDGGPEAGPSKSEEACRFWQKGKCKKGAACPFFHDPAVEAAQRAAREPERLAAVASIGLDEARAAALLKQPLACKRALRAVENALAAAKDTPRLRSSSKERQDSIRRDQLLEIELIRRFAGSTLATKGKEGHDFNFLDFLGRCFLLPADAAQLPEIGMTGACSRVACLDHAARSERAGELKSGPQGQGFDVQDFPLGIMVFDPSNPSLRAQLLAALGAPPQSTFEAMRGFHGGMNEGIWFVKGGGQTLVLKLVKFDRFAPQQLVEERMFTKLFQDKAAYLRRKGGKADLMKIFGKVGECLANFHRRYGGRQHNDAGTQNILWDEDSNPKAAGFLALCAFFVHLTGPLEETQHVTLIDLGCMGNKSNKTDVQRLSQVVKNLSACAAYGPDLVDPASALKASNRLQHQTSNRAVQLRPRFLISKKATTRPCKGSRPMKHDATLRLLKHPLFLSSVYPTPIHVQELHSWGLKRFGPAARRALQQRLQNCFHEARFRWNSVFDCSIDQNPVHLEFVWGFMAQLHYYIWPDLSRFRL
eukprot:s162_g25.t1